MVNAPMAKYLPYACSLSTIIRVLAGHTAIAGGLVERHDDWQIEQFTTPEEDFDRLNLRVKLIDGMLIQEQPKGKSRFSTSEADNRENTPPE